MQIRLIKCTRMQSKDERLTYEMYDYEKSRDVTTYRDINCARIFRHVICECIYYYIRHVSDIIYFRYYFIHISWHTYYILKI